MSTPGVAVGSAWSGRRGWSPGWAITVAAVGALLALVPVVYGAGVLMQPSIGNPTADGMGAAIGQVSLAAGLVTLAFLGWFLVRGGRGGFVVGTALVALGVGYYVLLGL